MPECLRVQLNASRNVGYQGHHFRPQFAGAFRQLEASYCRSKLKFRNEWGDVKEVTLFSVAFF